MIFETGTGFFVLTDLVGDVSRSLIKVFIADTFTSVREFDYFIKKIKDH